MLTRLQQVESVRDLREYVNTTICSSLSASRGGIFLDRTNIVAMWQTVRNLLLPARPASNNLYRHLGNRSQPGAVLRLPRRAVPKNPIARPTPVGLGRSVIGNHPLTRTTPIITEVVSCWCYPDARMSE